MVESQIRISSLECYFEIEYGYRWKGLKITNAMVFVSAYADILLSSANCNCNCKRAVSLQPIIELVN